MREAENQIAYFKESPHSMLSNANDNTHSIPDQN